MLNKVPQIFDYKLFKTKFMPLNATTIELQAFLVEILQQRLGLFSRKFPDQIQHHFSKCTIREKIIEMNPEALPFIPHSADLVLSAGPLMFTNDIPGVLKQWYATLKPGGVFMASFFGEETFIELKSCFLRVEETLNFPHGFRFFPTVATKDAGMLMQRAGFYLPTADRTRKMFHVKQFVDLLNVLKAMGGNILQNRPSTSLTREFLKAVEAEYVQRYSSDEQLRVTVDIVCMTGWAIERYAEERIQQNTPKNIGYV